MNLIKVGVLPPVVVFLPFAFIPKPILRFDRCSALYVFSCLFEKDRKSI